GGTGDGELCVTMLIPGSKPLIRYRTGDLVSIQSRPGYPQSMRQTVKVVGRVKDAVHLNDRAFSAAQIEQALLEGVEQCLAIRSSSAAPMIAIPLSPSWRCRASSMVIAHDWCC
ncbi:hypothetical protein QNM99_10990, partial [Pseudomonas sp. PCH446]